MADASAEPSEAVASLQREVQRLLGRFLLKMQQYEHYAKALLSGSRLSGTTETLLTSQRKRQEEISSQPLGVVIGELKKSYLRVTQDPEVGTTVSEKPADTAVEEKMTFTFESQIEMSAADKEKTVADFANLVSRRNRVVHHLVADYDLRTLDGCNAAAAYLEECFGEADRMLVTIKEWHDSDREARKHHAEFLQSPQWLDILLHGILPDRMVDWPSSTIVRLLRDAEALDAADGWTNLAMAIKRIGLSHPDHVPSRYFCSTWRQVLSQSAQFDIRRDKGVDGGSGITWFRSRGMSSSAQET